MTAPSDLLVPDPAPAADVLALERVMADSWPATEVAHHGGWLLRASGGWTGRGNSAVPLTASPSDPDGNAAAIAAIRAWYAARDLPPVVSVQLPLRAELEDHLLADGWGPMHGGLVLTADLARVAQHCRPVDDAPPVRVDDDPDDGWLGSYHYRGGDLPPQARAILTGGGARFASIRDGGDVLAIVRWAVDPPWAGITAMEVDPAHRRRGLARHLLAALAAWGPEQGVTRAWLQVDPENTAGRALYGAAGFTAHHRYQYLRG